MTICKKVLLKKVWKQELKEAEKNKTVLRCASSLDEILNEVYFARRPKPTDYINRSALVRIFNTIAKELYGDSNDSPVVESFGSFVMNIFSPRSDLDLSINLGDSAVEVSTNMKIKALQKFAKKLNSLQGEGHVTGIQKITNARVPIIKVIDCGTQIECDLSVNNIDGIAKSRIIHIISRMDERFQKLSFLMKEWAKEHNINSAKDRSLNSLSIISLVAFHLQTRDPPILPPFSALLRDGTDISAVRKISNEYMNYGQRNKESVAVLFITLLFKLASAEKLWKKGLCASLYQGSWISRTWDKRDETIKVEDFTDQTQNVARAVGDKELKKIYRCIRRSLCDLLSFTNGKLLRSKLREHLFGGELLNQGESTKLSTDNAASEIPNHVETDWLSIQGGIETANSANIQLCQVNCQTKRKRVMEELEERLEDKGWGGKRRRMES